MSFRITFLGTGGGRHTTMYQVRSTGGMLIEHDGRFLHVDPGPGALTQMHRIRYDLTRTESLIVSHCHPDHYSDAESVLEGMSRRMPRAFWRACPEGDGSSTATSTGRRPS